MSKDRKKKNTFVLPKLECVVLKSNKLIGACPKCKNNSVEYPKRKLILSETKYVMIDVRKCRGCGCVTVPFSTYQRYKNSIKPISCSTKTTERKEMGKSEDAKRDKEFLGQKDSHQHHCDKNTEYIAKPVCDNIILKDNLVAILVMISDKERKYYIYKGKNIQSDSDCNVYVKYDTRFGRKCLTALNYPDRMFLLHDNIQYTILRRSSFDNNIVNDYTNVNCDDFLFDTRVLTDAELRVMDYDMKSRVYIDYLCYKYHSDNYWKLSDKYEYIMLKTIDLLTGEPVLMKAIVDIFFKLYYIDHEDIENKVKRGIVPAFRYYEYPYMQYQKFLYSLYGYSRALPKNRRHHILSRLIDLKLMSSIDIIESIKLDNICFGDIRNHILRRKAVVDCDVKFVKEYVKNSPE